MSGDLVASLKRRAMGFLRAAESVDDPDLAAFFAEQAMQIYLKAVLYEVLGRLVRGHGLRELLGLLARGLSEEGYGELAERVWLFASDNRALLIMAEEAHTLARYGAYTYSQEEAARLVELAKRLVELLEEVARLARVG